MKILGEVLGAIIGFWLVFFGRVPPPMVKESVPLSVRVLAASNALHGKR